MTQITTQITTHVETAESSSPRMIRNICVYCGSAAGTDPLYDAAARKLGRILAEANIGLVYGGGGRGLMGIIANSVIEHGGTVTGIIPSFLTTKEQPVENAPAHVIVPDMHSRKRLMFEQADAFIALPGGIGTLEELVEQLTWVQLGRHTKPVVIADIGGFWRPLLALFAHMREHGFIQSAYEVRYLVAETIEDALPMIEAALAKTQALGNARETLDKGL
ncbi:MAG: LOG family protein [Methylovirgula sp.]